MVRAPGVPCRKIGAGQDLLPVGVLREVAEEIAALAAGQNLEGLLALWALPQVLSAGGEADLGERAAGEVNLILDRGEVQILAAVDGGLNRTEEREPTAILIDVVVEQTGNENVGWGQIHLQAREIAGGQVAAAILAARQLADDIYIIESVEGVIKPGAAFGDGA